MAVIGVKRNRVDLQHRTATVGEMGERTWTYSSYATQWASIEPLRGRELEFAQQIEAVVDVQIGIRHNANLINTDRIVWGSRRFEIEAILNQQERNREMTLLCKELK